MASHEATCPACGSALRVDVYPHVGGSVEESVGLSLALSEEEQQAQFLIDAHARAAAEQARLSTMAADAAKAVLAAAEARQAASSAATRVNADKGAAAKAALAPISQEETS